MAYLDYTGLQRFWEQVKNRLDNKVDKSEGQSDWSVDDATSPSYVKNRTHYDTILSKTLFDGTITATAGKLTRINSIPDEMIVNYPDVSVVHATFDGKACTITATTNKWELRDPNGQLVFTMNYDTAKGAQCLVSTYAGSGAHTLVIEANEITAVPLDEKYIPNTIPRRTDIPKMAMPDWNASEGEAGYVKNRTHYEEKNVIIPNTIIDVPSSDLFAALPVLDTAIVAGGSYVVELDNEKYTCVAWADGDVIYLGNGNVYPGVNKGENVPFSIDTYPDKTAFLNTQVGKEYVVSIAIPGNIKKLDEKFLPDDLVKEDDLTNYVRWADANQMFDELLVKPDKVSLVNGKDGSVELTWDDLGGIQYYTTNVVKEEDGGAIVETYVRLAYVSELTEYMFPDDPTTVEVTYYYEHASGGNITTGSTTTTADYNAQYFTDPDNGEVLMTFINEAMVIVLREGLTLQYSNFKIVNPKVGIYLLEAHTGKNLQRAASVKIHSAITSKIYTFNWPEGTTNPIPEKYLPESVKATPNWNAAEGEAGYIENRTHWEELEKELIVENYGLSNNMYSPQNKIKLNEYLNHDFICIIDGVEEYVTGPVQTSSSSGTSGDYSYKGTVYTIRTSIGTLKLTYRDFSSTAKVDDWITEMSTSQTGSWNLTLYAVEPIIHQLDEKFIPSTIARTADIPNLSDVATTSYVDTKVAELVDSSPDTLNTLNELAAALGDDPNFATTIATQIGELEESKVEKITGKGLSTNDFTNAEKNKLAEIAANYVSTDDIADLNEKVTAAHSHATTYKGSAFANGLYKITTNAEGHITGATAVAKADITALGIPAQDTDTGATSVEVTGAGNAITTASYDAASRKLTLTKGATYTNNQGTITGVNAGTSLSGGGTSGVVSISHAEGSAINKVVGLYKFATDATSHVKNVTAVNKADIVALGIPAQDTTYSAITNAEIDAICGQL